MSFGMTMKKTLRPFFTHNGRHIPFAQGCFAQYAQTEFIAMSTWLILPIGGQAQLFDYALFDKYLTRAQISQFGQGQGHPLSKVCHFTNTID